jgi:alkaline phosphatase D
LKTRLIHICLLTLIIFLAESCRKETAFVNYNFDSISDRIWIGEDFWSVPLEDWNVHNGRVEFMGEGQQSTLTVLPYTLSEKENPFSINIEMGLLDTGFNKGSAGLVIGSKAIEEDDIRDAVYFGSGIKVGVNTEGYAFIDQETKSIPDDFGWNHFCLNIIGEERDGKYVIKLSLLDAGGDVVLDIETHPENSMRGIVQVVNNFRSARSQDKGPKFWYDNLTLEGTRFVYNEKDKFGPVLWTMHTLSHNTLKLTAQMPPLGAADNKSLELQIKNGEKWTSSGSQKMDPDSRTATFRVENWHPGEEKEYRVVYLYKDVFGKDKTYEYSGKIRKEPLDRPLLMGAMTCQYHTGFPYSPVVKNLKLKEPDILYFSGDQIYEQNGGYPIKREPEDTAILNYLGKWYMFGWAFRDLMRDIPAICTPDDHDVFQGNLWGGGGIPKPTGQMNTDDFTGFTQTVKMVNVVNRTQCGHLPDPFDPEPIKQGMNVWYTNLNYGRISFAIVSDRIFKSGPDLVATWEGRKDHITEPLKDPSSIERDDLELLGKRQEQFLENWIRDWENVDMKVLLSQTLFANVATHHGQHDSYLYGDMDSGGWPKGARDRAIEIMRKAFVFHIAGDQHLPSIVQYGINDFRDAGWCFCTPAISVGYSRWFRPDEMNYPVSNRPDHGLPNTGEYKDAFGNLNYVYAVGNPGNFGGIRNRYEFQKEKTAGFGFVIFDKETRDIKIESWRFLCDVLNPGENSQHPGWPLTINQMDNYGREAVAWLPLLKIKGETDPVVEIINQSTGKLEYIVRINGNEFMPKVFSHDSYKIRIGYPEKNLYKELIDIEPSVTKGSTELSVELN